MSIQAVAVQRSAFVAIRCSAELRRAERVFEVEQQRHDHRKLAPAFETGRRGFRVHAVEFSIASVMPQPEPLSSTVILFLPVL